MHVAKTNRGVETFRVYLIGAGVIARTHADTVRTLFTPGHVTLSVADPVPQVLTRFIEQYPEARSFDNAQEMLDEPAQEGDIVIVATPPWTHCDLACMALSTGRHVLCEKPFAITRAQALQMLRTAKATGRVVGCCSTRQLGTPSTQEARRLLQEGVLGKVYHVRFIQRYQRARAGIEYQPASTWFLDRSRSGGGIVIDWGPYDFTVLNHLFQPTRIEFLGAWMANPITAVQLTPGTVFDVEEHAGALLRYHLPDATTVMVSYERAACTQGKAESILEVEGLDGAVSWDWLAWGQESELTYSYDKDGQLESKTSILSNEGLVTGSQKPLYYFHQYLLGNPSLAVVNEQAVFDFSCICAFYDCVSSGMPQTVSWEGL
ncbi:MAG TPA: Gfo/Idh/MocA family oxidoreductase [Ktedonobacteraceae bacterium]|nr:Gfo/Idh/MocA family oxidoreductase [Ktedonobacteraceae bacterium]